MKKNSVRICIALAVLFVVYVFMNSTNTPSMASASVEPALFAQKLEMEAERQLIDVRTLQEFQAGHLDGAINLDFYQNDFATQIAELDRTKQYAIYCRTGNRTGETRKLMEQLGFTDVIELQGGIVAWETEFGQTCVGGVC